MATDTLDPQTEEVPAVPMGKIDAVQAALLAAIKPAEKLAALVDHGFALFNSSKGLILHLAHPQTGEVTQISAQELAGLTEPMIKRLAEAADPQAEVKAALRVVKKKAANLSEKDLIALLKSLD